jgi:fibronectin type 3 domain-containing protein
MVPEKGAWMYFNGAWDMLPNLGAGLDYNWCVEGIVGGKDAVLALNHNTLPQTNYKVTGNANFEMKTHSNYNTRSLSGYKIYRNSTEIAEITDPTILEYTDADLLADSYDYYVTAVYEGVESAASNTETVEVTLPAPANFSAVSQAPTSSNILCTWDAPAKERALTHYNVYRDGEIVGTPTNTLYVDANVPDGTYEYYATAVYSEEYESDASEAVTVEHYTSDNDNPNVPAVTTLVGNYPNPFNPTTQIKFTLAKPGKVSLDIFNVKGEKIATLLNTSMTAASHTVVWNGTDNYNQKVSSGIYYYRLQTDNYSHIKKMILMK